MEHAHLCNGYYLDVWKTCPEKTIDWCSTDLWVLVLIRMAGTRGTGRRRRRFPGTRAARRRPAQEGSTRSTVLRHQCTWTRFTHTDQVALYFLFDRLKKGRSQYDFSLLLLCVNFGCNLTFSCLMELVFRSISNWCPFCFFWCLVGYNSVCVNNHGNAVKLLLLA